MGLLFADNTTDEVIYGSAASLDDLTTPSFLAWIKPTNNSNSFRNWGGKGTNLDFFRRGVDGTRLAVQRVYSGTDPIVEIATGNMTTGWNFVAFTMDWAVSNKAYWGDLSTVVSDKSANAALSTGTLTSDAASNFTLGSNQGAGANAAAPYNIAWFGVWNRILTLGELKDQQYRPHVTSGCVLFTHLGFNGTTSCPDWSGKVNNGATVTGATQAAHVPLGRPFFRGEDYSPYVVSAGGVLFRRTLFNRAGARGVA